jgi:hypothetical protein
MSQANAPRQTITRASGISASSASSHGRQLSRSTGSGLFAGGAQRTPAVMKQPLSASPSSRCTEVGWLAKPVACSAA